MKIIVIGNMCSGKSTFISQLNGDLQLPVISIDDFRMRYGDFTWAGNQKAVSRFIQAIRDDDTSQIIECSGGGRTGSRLQAKLSCVEDQKLVVLLNTDPTLCSVRAQSKLWHELKLPGEWISSVMANIWKYEPSHIMQNYTRYPIIVVNNLLKHDVAKTAALIKTTFDECKRR